MTNEVLILPQRRCGNTTRQIDAEIQELFTKGSVVVNDHADRPGNGAQRDHLRQLSDRLDMQFDYKLNRDYTYNEKTRTIRFIKREYL